MKKAIILPAWVLVRPNLGSSIEAEQISSIKGYKKLVMISGKNKLVVFEVLFCFLNCQCGGKRVFPIVKAQVNLKGQFQESTQFHEGLCFLHLLVKVFPRYWEWGTGLNLTVVTSWKETPINLLRMNSELLN